MRLSFKPARTCASAWLIVVGSLPSCKDKEGGTVPMETSPRASASAELGCADGTSDDPPKSEFRAAIGALRDKDYVAAQQRLRNLCEKYPRSASARVWLGDAILYDSEQEYASRADDALDQYRIAEALHARGCTLREPMHYYLMMGSAYAYLRKREVAEARKHLNAAAERWPTSAEIAYHHARASAIAGEFDDALAQLGRTFELAQTRQRPMFLRVHRSLDDWFERAEDQSEFEKLLRERAPQYQALKQRFQVQAAPALASAPKTLMNP